MPHFSTHSRKELDTCCDSLRLLASAAIRYIDFKIIEGYKSYERQAYLYHSGESKTPPGLSKHNKSPSEAVDIAPYPVDWQDTDRFIYFAGRILQIADDMGILIKWSGDLNMDTFLKERSNFLGHFEIYKE